MRNFHNLPGTERGDIEPVLTSVPEEGLQPGTHMQMYPSGVRLSALYPDYGAGDDGMTGLYRGGSDPHLYAAGRG